MKTRFWCGSVLLLGATLLGCSDPEGALEPGVSIPSTTTDLTASITTPSSITLVWSSPVVASTTEKTYDLRMSTSEITRENWLSAVPIETLLEPKPPGASESIVVTGLEFYTIYYFALKTVDGNGEASDVSNIVAQRTTTGWTQFTSSVSDHVVPDWSPDGTRLCFNRRANGIDVSVRVLSVLDGVQSHLVAPTALYPSWSPDGQRLCYSQVVPAVQAAVATLDLVTGVSTHITPDSVWSFAPAWSPDGSEIAVASTLNHPAGSSSGNAWICIVPSGGGELRPVSSSEGDDGHPSWSPDGSHIVFDSHRDGDWNLWITGRSGEESQLTHNGGIDPDWSPDGEWIVFQNVVDGNRDLYAIKPDGTNEIRLTTYGSEESDPTWSPDSRWIAFSSDRRGANDIWGIEVAPMLDGSLPERGGDWDLSSKQMTILRSADIYDPESTSESPSSQQPDSDRCSGNR